MNNLDDIGQIEMIDVRLDGDHGVFVWSDEVGVKLFNIEPLAEIGRLDTGSTVSACNIGRNGFRLGWIS